LKISGLYKDEMFKAVKVLKFWRYNRKERVVLLIW